MRSHLAVFLLSLAVVFFGPTALHAGSTEKRIAFVVGNGEYPGAKLPTAANDAGLIAQTLQAAGFDVMGARDLDEEILRQSYREFLQKAAAAGPAGVVFVYLSGYGLQYEGENYFVPIGASIASASDVPIAAIRLTDLTKPLAAIPLKARIVVFDAARENPFAKSGPPLAGGLALVDPDPGALIAFNAAPGTLAPARTDGAYGAYAQALAEMMREGGLPVDEVFDRVRLRVNEVTKGAQVPWDASKISAPLRFFDRAPDAPPPAAPGPGAAFLREKPIRDFSAEEAYAAALERDTLQGYEAFLAAYPEDPMARRIRALLAARREAITWRQTTLADSPDGYWSYLRRYPRGPHVHDARRRLGHFSAAPEPPPSFPMISYDVPPPPPAEIVYVDRPVLVFSDPYFDFAPPPPPPVFFLPPPPPAFIVLEPPPWPVDPFFLPVPVFVPLPLYINPPPYVVAPPNDIVFNNIHQTTVNNLIVNNPAPVASPGFPNAPASPGIPNAAGPGPARPFVGLPAAVQQRVSVPQGQSGLGSAPSVVGPGVAPSVAPGAGNNFGQRLHGRPQGTVQPPQGLVQPGQRSQPLPGAGGQPLPAINGKPPGAPGAQGARGGVGAAPLNGVAGQQGTGTKQAPANGVHGGQPLPGAGGQSSPAINGKPPGAPGAQGARGGGGVAPAKGLATPQGQGLKQGPSNGAGGAQPPVSPRLQNAAPRHEPLRQPPAAGPQQRQKLPDQPQPQPQQFHAPPQQYQNPQRRQFQPPPQQQQHQPQQQFQAPQQQQRQFQPPAQQQQQRQPPRQFQAPQQQQRQFQPPPQQQQQQRQPPQQQQQQQQRQPPPQQQQRQPQQQQPPKKVPPVPGQPQ